MPLYIAFSWAGMGNNGKSKILTKTERTNDIKIVVLFILTRRLSIFGKQIALKIF